MAFYVVCYIVKSEEGNASQIICSLDYKHVKSFLANITETFPFTNRCYVPFPFVGSLVKKDSYLPEP